MYSVARRDACSLSHSNNYQILFTSVASQLEIKNTSWGRFLASTPLWDLASVAGEGGNLDVYEAERQDINFKNKKM